nr:NADH dehydrogenase subunit 4 [Sagra femorata]
MMKFIFCFLFMIPFCFMGLFWELFIVFLVLSGLWLFLNVPAGNFCGLTYLFGIDNMSFMMILLSLWICGLMILASEKIFLDDNYYGLFLFLIMLLIVSLICFFGSFNLFFFYLFFEVSLIPTLILIIGWGYQPERVEAGVYLLFYTLFVSLPMMVSIFFCYQINFSLMFYYMICQMDWMVYFCMSMVFLVKIPMFFIHLWLPKAHVEAPIAGSMILAGVLLKMGGYGLYRVYPMFLKVGMNFNFIFISISLLGGLLVSLMCFRQSDIKSLIAYSSVAHMGLVLSGLMSLNCSGLSGALVMMFAHGLCSSGLFCLANCSYERLESRSLYLNKGLINILPSLSLFWFLFSACNMASPPSLNLIGEVLLINSLVSYSSYTMIFLMSISFLGAGYSLYLYSFSQQGLHGGSLYSFYSISFREFLLLFLHYVPLNLLFFKIDFFL